MGKQKLSAAKYLAIVMAEDAHRPASLAEEVGAFLGLVLVEGQGR